jgi:RNA polymerase sigma-70 factor (ECF subfamily)
LDAPAATESGSWDEILQGTDWDPADFKLQQEEDQMIQQALNTLPVTFRTAVVLCDIEGLSYERISEIMVCPIGTVRSRVHQGRVLMRKAFEEIGNRGKTQ